MTLQHSFRVSHAECSKSYTRLVSSEQKVQRQAKFFGMSYDRTLEQELNYRSCGGSCGGWARKHSARKEKTN